MGDAEMRRRGEGERKLLTGKTPRPVLSVFITGLLAIRMTILCGRLPIAQILTPAPRPDRPLSHLSHTALVPP